MMDIWDRITGVLTAEITAADPELVLKRIVDFGIPLLAVTRMEDGLSVQCTVHRRFRTSMEALAQKCDFSLSWRKASGFSWYLERLFRRPVLCIGLILLLVISLYLPSRIYFVRIEGNIQVPTRKILEACEECGIGFGASRKMVRSQKVKDALLEVIPQLQWAGVNTSGCVATVKVQERKEELPPIQFATGLVASRDGVIVECTVTKGTQVCRVGQVVRQGQLLISGYTDGGDILQSTGAQGEVYAQTRYDFSAIVPQIWARRTNPSRQEKKYSLIIGKKRINFYKDSGILDSSCVKIYTENYAMLPGGFRLPIILVEEVTTFYEATFVELSEQNLTDTLSNFANRYITDHMIAGRIIGAWEKLETMDGVTTLDGDYACVEMIARIQYEENSKPDGNYD